MAATRISHMPALNIAANVFGTIFIGFGINAMLSPQKALEFFELSYPVSTTDQQVVDALLIVYGARDIFMGLAIYAATYFGNSKAAGAIVVSASAVAFVDGAVCWLTVGKGMWSHWGYAPVLTTVGSLLLGVLDKA